MEHATPAFYRTVDPLDHMCARISIRKTHNTDGQPLVAASLATGAAAPTAAVPVAMSATFGGGSVPGTSGGGPSFPSVFDEDVAEYVVEFAWQQKVFGPRELLKYSAALKDLSSGARSGGSFTPLEREYMSIISSRGDSIFASVSSIMLFTYTDRDGYIPPGEAVRAPTSRRTSSMLGQDEHAAVSRLAGDVVNPGAAPRGVVAHAVKEHPYSDMYVMAAVGIAKEDYRAARSDTRMYEVPLLHVRAHGGGGGTTLLELRPGFAEPLPVEMGVLRAAIAGGLTTYTSLGPGAYGGDLKLRMLRLPSYVPPPPAEAAAAFTATMPAAVMFSTTAANTLAAATGPLGSTAGFATPNRVGGASTPAPMRSSLASLTSAAGTGAAGSGSSVAAIVEVHALRTQDGAAYEFILTNPDEDAVTALMSVAATGGAAPVSAMAALGAATSTMHTALLSDVAAVSGLDGSVSDPLASLLASQRRAVETSAHRFGSDFFSTLPPRLSPHSMRIACYLELVAAAHFNDAALSGHGVYVAYELVLPTGCGWRLLESEYAGTKREYAVSRSTTAAAAATRRASNSGVAVSQLHEEAAAAAEEEVGDEAGEDGTASSAVSPPAGQQPRRRKRHEEHSTGPTEALHRTRVRGVTQVARFKQQPWAFGAVARPAPAASNQSSIHESVFGTPVGGSASGSAGTRTARVAPYTSGAGSSSMVTTQHVDGVIPANAFVGRLREAEAGMDCASPEAAYLQIEEATSDAYVAHLCYPIEVHLLCDMGACISPAGPAPPTLYVTLYARDSWDRHTLLGYGTYDLPLQPGVHSHVVHTWVPRQSAAAAEQAFFVGGGTRLDDPLSAGLPPHLQAARVMRDADVPGTVTASRFGLETVTAGDLGVRCSTVKVRYPPRANPQVAEAVAAARLQTVNDIITRARVLKAAASAPVVGSVAAQPASKGPVLTRVDAPPPPIAEEEEFVVRAV